MKGLFIALEGSDGSGKTTVWKGLQERFHDAKIPVLYTREPGGTPISEKIRTLLLDPENREMSPMTEALLYAASRAQHVNEVLRPALAMGKIVLSDRYVISSLAYQGAGRGLGMQRVWKLNEEAMQGIFPDCTIFLDVDPLTVLQRKARVARKDRLEDSGDDFFQKVYEGYCKAIEEMPHVVRVDATQSPQQVLDATWQAIESAYDAWKRGGSQ